MATATPSANDQASMFARMNPMGGYHNFLDATINASLIKVLSGEGLDINISAIMWIVLFSCIGELKELGKWVVLKIKENGYEYSKWIWDYIKNIEYKKGIMYVLNVIWMFEIKKSKSKEIIEELIVETNKNTEKTFLNIYKNYQIFDAILTFIDDGLCKGSYTRKILGTDSENLHEHMTKVRVSDVTLFVENVKVEIKTELIAKYSNTSNYVDKMNMISLFEAAASSDAIIVKPSVSSSTDAITSIAQLIDNSEIINFFHKYDAVISKMKNPGLSAPEEYSEFKCDENISVFPTKLVPTIKHVYSSKWTSTQFMKIFAQSLILYHFGKKDISFEKNNVIFNKLNTRLLLSSHKITDFNMSSCKLDTTHNALYEKHILVMVGEHAKIFEKEFEKIMNNQKIDIVDERIQNDIKINVELSEVDLALPYSSKKQLADIWNLYLYNVIIKSYSDKKLNLDEVSVYMLKISESVEKKEVPNPDYTAYMEKRSMLESFSRKRLIKEPKKEKESETKTDTDTDTDKKPDTILQDDGDDVDIISPISPGIMFGMGMHKVPPQTITEKVFTYSVQQHKEGQVVKRLDTLFLRKKDMTKLASTLKSFNENSQIYTDLCITKKLGFMLHGFPGTGKTSTIMAIATYLKYDIYYVSLNGVTKNSQIKMIFDFVSKNCSKKGMLVFEDIDAQTDVVHKRNIIVSEKPKHSKHLALEIDYPQMQTETIDESSINMHTLEAKKDDNLDLSFLLNCFDGTLSQQNMVYVMTTNHIERLDPALYRKGRINVVIDMKKCDRHQVSCIFEKIMKRPLNPLILGTVLEDSFTPAEFIFHLMENIYETNLSDEEIMRDFCKQCKEIIPTTDNYMPQ